MKGIIKYLIPVLIVFLIVPYGRADEAEKNVLIKIEGMT
jgi:hypothetical protein